MTFKFSNFQELEKPLVYDGISYPTVEHFYMAMKTEDKTIRSKIASLPHAGAAKKYGRKIQLRSNWEDIKLKVMYHALKHKFQPGTKAYGNLKSFEGEIVEDNYWHDNYWGNCICNKCKHIEGQNYLGKLLMHIRDKL